jgi:type II secretory pathway component GspD/PulD (secretin)
MNKHNSFKLLICLLAVILLSSVDKVKSDTESQTQDTTAETVGKQNPFEVVKPITEIRRNLLQRNSGSTVSTVSDGSLPLSVRSVMLKFLQAENVESAVRGMLSASGVVTTDKETNTLIICDTPDRLDIIIAEIRQADKTPKQIMVEVVIVDVKLKDETEIGVNWEGLVGTAKHTNWRSQQTLINDLGTSTTYEGALFGFAKDGIDVSVHALQTTRDVEILASPRLLVVSGQDAEIQTTEEIPYVELTQSTGGVTSTDSITSTKFKDAGITLKVKATLTDEQKILMTIEPEQSVNTGTSGIGNTTVPIVDKRSAKTTLLMDDGQVVVMGGLRRKDTRLTVDKVPLLGDLPIVGFLFSNDKYEIEHSELLVFISPHIYDDGPLSEMEMERFNELRNKPPLSLPMRERPEYKAMQDWLKDISIQE